MLGQASKRFLHTKPLKENFRSSHRNSTRSGSFGGLARSSGLTVGITKLLNTRLQENGGCGACQHAQSNHGGLHRQGSNSLLRRAFKNGVPFGDGLLPSLDHTAGIGQVTLHLLVAGDVGKDVHQAEASLRGPYTSFRTNTAKEPGVFELFAHPRCFLVGNLTLYIPGHLLKIRTCNALLGLLSGKV